MHGADIKKPDAIFSTKTYWQDKTQSMSPTIIFLLSRRRLDLYQTAFRNPKQHFQSSIVRTIVEHKYNFIDC